MQIISSLFRATTNLLVNKLKIPTILGLGIIVTGMVAGLYLNQKNTVFLSQAAIDAVPKNITLTNTTEDSATISWQTDSEAASFITFGQNSPKEQTALDDLDLLAATRPRPRFTHYVTLKNLLPKTSYQFKVISGRISSEITRFETASPLSSQTGFTPIIGSVLNENTPLDEGNVYLSIPGAITQSAPIKMEGNFLIPLSSIRKADLSDVYQLTEDITAKLTVISGKGNANLLFKLRASSTSLPPIKLGQNIDLTTIEPTSPPITSTQLNEYDLNKDGQINTADYAIVSSCFGKKPTTILPGNIACNKTDINGDGKTNQKDLDLMSQKLSDPGFQQ